MKRWFGALVLAASVGWAGTLEAWYEIRFGIFGQIGQARANHSIDGERYRTQMHAYATGLTRALSQERQEWFESQGKIDETGRLRPEVFVHTIERVGNQSVGLGEWERVVRKDTRVYRFDHEEQKVFLTRTRTRNGIGQAQAERLFDYYASEDLLSLFFNMKLFSNNFTDYDTKAYYAVGANKDEGRVDVEFLGKKGPYYAYTVRINQPIFSSKEGLLHVKLNEEGLCEEAVLENVLFFGDIKARRSNGSK